MEQLISFLLQYGNLNKVQVDLITTKFKEVVLHKDEYFSEAGKFCQKVGFILDGVIRICYYNNKGEEITRDFIDDNSFVADLSSCVHQIPSSEYYQAVTDTRILVLTQSDWQELAQTIVAWDAISNKVLNKTLLKSIERISPLVAEDATTRYLSFIEKYPNITNRIPLSYLASYLGITQSSLSRIRKKNPLKCFFTKW